MVGVEKDTMMEVNPFVNLKKRAIELPTGCKDLNDLLLRIENFRPDTQGQFTEGGFAEIRTYVGRLCDGEFTGQVLFILHHEKSVILIVSHDGDSIRLELLLHPDDAFVKEALTEIFGESGLQFLTDIRPLQYIRVSLPKHCEEPGQPIIDFLLRAYSVSEADKFILLYQDRKNWPLGR